MTPYISPVAVCVCLCCEENRVSAAVTAAAAAAAGNVPASAAMAAAGRFGKEEMDERFPFNLTFPKMFFCWLES